MWVCSVETDVKMKRAGKFSKCRPDREKYSTTKTRVHKCSSTVFDRVEGKRFENFFGGEERKCFGWKQERVECELERRRLSHFLKNKMALRICGEFHKRTNVLSFRSVSKLQQCLKDGSI